MARPQKPADARADVRITVRLTASEAASLNAAATAAGRSVSEHIRQVALTAPAYRRRRGGDKPSRIVQDSGLVRS